MTKLNLARSEEKILCPYCGAEMKPISYAACPGKWRAWMSCTNDDCGAEGPMIQEAENKETGIGSARAAALLRYTPPIKPMTLEEALERLTVWREYQDEQETKAVIIKEYWNGNLELRGYYLFIEKPERHLYGKEWRCWERRPTDEERRAAEWKN